MLPSVMVRKIDPAVWDRVDWDRSDAELAGEIGCSSEYVRRKRAAIGRARAPEPLESPDTDADISEIVGWRIRLHRRRHGWSAAELADRVNDHGRSTWTKHSIGHIERASGERGLTLEWLGRFAVALAVTPADLVRRPDQAGLEHPPHVPDEASDSWSSLRSSDAPSMRRVAGINVARWRAKRGLSPRELGDLVCELGGGSSWSASRVSAAEGSGRRLTIVNLACFAEALDVTPADLVRLPRQPALKGPPK